MDEYQRIIRLLVDAAQADKELKKIRGEVEKTNRFLGDFQASFRRLRQAFFTGLAVAGVVRTLGGLVKRLVDAREQFDLLEASFTILTGSAERGAQVIEQVGETIVRTGANFDAVVDGFRQVQVGLSGFGASNKQVQAVVESFIQLGRIAGASTQNVNAALYQLSQGLASNRLQGDELRSILERMPIFAQLLSEEMGIAVGQLREAAAAGRTTADVVANALIRNMNRLNEEASQLPTRLGEAGNRLGLVWRKFLAGLNESTQTTEVLIWLYEGVAAWLERSKNTMELIRAAWAGVMALVRIFASIVTVIAQAFEDIAMRIVFIAKAIQNPTKADTLWTQMKKDLAESRDSANALLNNLIGVNDAVPIRKFTNAIEKVDELDAATAQVAVNTKRLNDFWFEVVEKVTEAEEAMQKLALVTDNTGYFFQAFLGYFKSGRWGFDAFVQSLESLYEINPAEIVEQLAWAVENFLLGPEEAARALALLKEKFDETKGAAEDAADAVTMVWVEFEDGIRYTRALTEVEARRNELLREAQKALHDYRVETDALADAQRVLAERLAAGRISWMEYVALMGAVGTEYENLTQGADDVNESLTETQEIMLGLADVVRASLAGAFDDLIDSIGKTRVAFSDFAADFMRDIAKMILRITVLERISAAIAEKFGPARTVSTGGSDTTAVGGGSTTGGAITFLGGAGSPRAAFAGGGVMPATIVNIQNHAAVQVSASERSVDGSRVLDVVIRDRIKAAVTDGSLDRVLGSTYGLRRQGRL